MQLVVPKSVVAVLGVLALAAAVAFAASATVKPAGASLSAQSISDELGALVFARAGNSLFAKYDGIDGESKDSNHDKWIDVLNVDWGAHKPGGGATGQSRRRGAAVVEDLTLTMEYEKSSPKLQEKCLKGEVIPKLEIEQTATYGGARATYLKYELKNVMVTSCSVSASDGGPTVVVIGNNFEEIKVTYTEYDDEGSKLGNVEFEYKVEKGA